VPLIKEGGRRGGANREENWHRDGEQTMGGQVVEEEKKKKKRKEEEGANICGRRGGRGGKSQARKL